MVSPSFLGPNPSVTKGTKVVLKVDPSRHEFNALHTWDCLFFKQSGLTSMVQIQISSSAPVGKWKCEMQSYSKYTSRYKSYTLETPIYILFNPFSQGIEYKTSKENLTFLNACFNWPWASAVKRRYQSKPSRLL